MHLFVHNFTVLTTEFSITSYHQKYPSAHFFYVLPPFPSNNHYLKHYFCSIMEIYFSKYFPVFLSGNFVLLPLLSFKIITSRSIHFVAPNIILSFFSFSFGPNQTVLKSYSCLCAKCSFLEVLGNYIEMPGIKFSLQSKCSVF